MSESFDENKFDSIVEDIMENEKITKPDMTINQIEDVISSAMSELNSSEESSEEPSVIKNSIEQGIYTKGDFEYYTNIFKFYINRKHFDETYLNTVISEIKTIKIGPMAGNLPPKEGFVSMAQRSMAQRDQLLGKWGSMFMELGLKKFAGYLKDSILYLYTLIIVANLNFRATIPSCILYPSDPDRFPYVYVDESSSTKDKYKYNITSTIQERSIIDEAEAAFERPMTVATSSGNDKDKNYKCSTVVDKKEEDNNKEKDKLTVDDMNSFASLFIDAHRETLPKDLGIYNLFTYVLLRVSCKLNGHITSLHNSKFFKYVFTAGGLIMLITIILFYILFSSNLKLCTKIVGRIIKYYGGKYDSVFKSFVKILASFVCPFITFMFILFVLVYPLTLFQSGIAYYEYMGITTRFLTKFSCFIGILFSTIALAGYVFILVKTIFPELIKFYIKQFKEMKDLINGKKKKKKKKNTANTTSSKKVGKSGAKDAMGKNYKKLSKNQKKKAAKMNENEIVAFANKKQDEQFGIKLIALKNNRWKRNFNKKGKKSKMGNAVIEDGNGDEQPLMGPALFDHAGNDSGNILNNVFRSNDPDTDYDIYFSKLVDVDDPSIDKTTEALRILKNIKCGTSEMRNYIGLTGDGNSYNKAVKDGKEKKSFTTDNAKSQYKKMSKDKERRNVRGFIRYLRQLASGTSATATDAADEKYVGHSTIAEKLKCDKYLSRSDFSNRSIPLSELEGRELNFAEAFSGMEGFSVMEGFSEKNISNFCSPKVSSFGFAALFGIILLFLIAIFALGPILLPFVSTTLSIMKLSYALTFESFSDYRKKSSELYGGNMNKIFALIGFVFIFALNVNKSLYKKRYNMNPMIVILLSAIIPFWIVNGIILKILPVDPTTRSRSDSEIIKTTNFKL